MHWIGSFGVLCVRTGSRLPFHVQLQPFAYCPPSLNTALLAQPTSVLCSKPLIDVVCVHYTLAVGATSFLVSLSQDSLFLRFKC